MNISYTFVSPKKISLADITSSSQLNNFLDDTFLYDCTLVFCVIPCRTNPDATLKFNEMDGKINRRSFTGKYMLVNGVPRYYVQYVIS